MYLMGPGDFTIVPSSGSQIYQLEQTPSGHLVLPVSNFAEAQQYERDRDQLLQAPAPMTLPIQEIPRLHRPAMTRVPTPPPAEYLEGRPLPGDLIVEAPHPGTVLLSDE